MSLFRRQQRVSAVDGPLIPPRLPAPRASISVTQETAMRHSAVWACLRLRANLVSTMPVDVYRPVGGMPVEVPKPPVLVNPGGERVDLPEWMYSTQVDLDRAGNAFGIVTARDSIGLPARIDLALLADVSVRARGPEIVEIQIGGETYKGDALRDVWHERQYTVAGLPVGLSPTAHAALSIGEYQSIQQFALDWFGDGTIPAAHLKNTSKTISAPEAAAVKDRFKAAVSGRDLFVTGSDWEYKMIQAEQASADWIEAKKFGIADIARFYDVPGDLIDAAVSTGSITYANVTQRNLQFLIMHLGPAVTRREHALNKLVPPPRYVKLNRSALLAMDPLTRAQTFKVQIDSRQLVPSEARHIDDRPPFTEAQLAEFDRLFGAANKPPATTTSGAPS